MSVTLQFARAGCAFLIASRVDLGEASVLSRAQTVPGSHKTAGGHMQVPLPQSSSDEILIVAVLGSVEVSTDVLHGWSVDKPIIRGIEPLEHLENLAHPDLITLV